MPEIHPNGVDRTGQRHGMLEVLGIAGRRGGALLWRCRCDCGREVVRQGGNLGRPRTKSCGCSSHPKKNRSAEEKLVRRSYWSMLSRCGNPQSPDYPDYGGRGITVCERWQVPGGCERFVADMGPRPSPTHSIDRRDTNGHYSPDNCRWATPQEQADNKRNNVILEYQGRSANLSQWSKELGINEGTLRSRIIRQKWSVTRAFETPIRRWINA